MAASRVSLSRKEWRAVTEQQHRNSGGGDEVNLEHSKLGQSDERTIYEVNVVAFGAGCLVKGLCKVNLV